MAGRGGSGFDLDNPVVGVLAAGLGIGALIGLAYHAGADVSERVLRQRKKDEREYEKKVRREQREKQKEERRKERLEWWRIFNSRRIGGEDNTTGEGLGG